MIYNSLLEAFNLPDSALEKFDVFCGYLLLKNKDFNITAIKTPEEVYLKHFSDSLFGARFFNKGDKIVELGSGGGFPSVPLKIFDEQLDFTLIEATAKKCEFLKSVKELLNFDKFDVINARCEELPEKNMREKFDCVTARALAPLRILCELSLPLIKKGGTAVLYKGSALQEELDCAQNAIKTLGAKVKEIYTYSLSETEGNRNILVLEKVNDTPAAYPRAYAKILKKPL